MAKHNLLILSPYLKLSEGESSLVTSLKGSWGVNEIYCYRGRGRHFMAKYISLILELFKFLIGLLYYKNSKILINTSLDKATYSRDNMFCFWAILFRKDVYIFMQGWDVDYFESIKNDFYKSSFYLSKKIFVLSQSFKNSLKATGYLGRDIIVEHTVVEEKFSDEFKNFQKDFDDRPIQILFLARIEEAMGVFTVLDSFKELVKEHPNLVLNIAGTGPGTDSVKKWIEKNSDLPIYFHGGVEGMKKVDIFKNAHIYVLPAKHLESMPVGVLEAICAGCVVFVAPSGGLMDFFKYKGMGFLLNGPSQQELTKKINMALKNLDSLKNIATNNLKKGQMLYTASSLINRIESNILNE